MKRISIAFAIIVLVILTAAARAQNKPCQYPTTGGACWSEAQLLDYLSDYAAASAGGWASDRQQYRNTHNEGYLVKSKQEMVEAIEKLRPYQSKLDSTFWHSVSKKLSGMTQFEPKTDTQYLEAWEALSTLRKGVMSSTRSN